MLRTVMFIFIAPRLRGVSGVRLLPGRSAPD